MVLPAILLQKNFHHSTAKDHIVSGAEIGEVARWPYR